MNIVVQGRLHFHEVRDDVVADEPAGFGDDEMMGGENDVARGEVAATGCAEQMLGAPRAKVVGDFPEIEPVRCAQCGEYHVVKPLVGRFGFHLSDADAASQDVILHGRCIKKSVESVPAVSSGAYAEIGSHVPVAGIVDGMMAGQGEIGYLVVVVTCIAGGG